MIFYLENENLAVQINSMGAELWSLLDKRSDKQLLWQGDPAVWPRRSPLLFPICGKLHSEKLPLHGFIRDYEHTVVAQNESEVTLHCGDNAQTRLSYPHSFDFETTYRLSGDTLHCCCHIVNRGNARMPFSFGFHTGFVASDSSVLHFAQPEGADRLLQDSAGFVSDVQPNFLQGQQLPLYNELFPSTVLLQNLQSQSVELVTDGEPVLRLDFAGFPYLAVWINQKPVPFVCIEPWHGLPDPVQPYADFEQKPGLLWLDSGGSFDSTQSISALSGR